MSEGAVFDIDSDATIADAQQTLRAIGAALVMLLKSGPQRVTIEPIKPECSNEARALYRIWLRAMAKHFSRKGNNFSDEDMHDLMRHMFLGYEQRKIGKTQLEPVLKSTKKGKITSEAMCVYMQQIDAWAADHGCLLPRPEDNDYAEWQRAAA